MSSSNRRIYETTTLLIQEVLDDCADNLAGKLELAAVITTSGGEIIRVSDRDKFIGTDFYESRVNFPEIKRTLGEWLSNTLEFSDINLQINNADEAFNNILPGGADYSSFIGSQVVISVGIAEYAASYIDIFSGKVTDVAGYERDRTSFTLIARSDLEHINETIPNQTLIEADFPDIEDDYLGLGAPVIYGDWTTDLKLVKLDPDDQDSGSAYIGHVPAFPVNGGSLAVNESLGDPSAGNDPLRCVISSTPIKTFLDAEVYLHRGNKYYLFDSADISVVGGSNNQIFDITQKNLMVDGKPWIYSSGDEFYVKVIGVDLGSYTDNIIAQGRDILERLVSVPSGDFSSSWNTVRDKAAPAQSAISAFKSRVWIQDGTPAFEYVLSMFEQVRVEAFVNRSNKFALSTLHFDDIGTNYDPDNNFTIRNWDLVLDTLKPKLNDGTNFNRAKADFDYEPSKGENRLSTKIFRNQDAIDQIGGRLISKLLTFPNLYKIDQVELQVVEILRMASAMTESVELALTTRAMLVELSDLVQLQVDIGSINYDGVPAMVRKLNYDPTGPSIKGELWSFQLINFPGYAGPAGTVGGYDATITEET